MPKINRPPQDGFIGSVKSHNNRLSYLERSVATSTPGARVTGATNSVANGGTSGTVNFTTVTYAFSPMTASGAQITAPVTGVYSAKVYVEFGAIASGQANFYIQNVTQSTNEQLGYATTNERSFFASDDIQANAGDVLQIGLNNSTGGSITFTANSFFTLTFVSSGSSAVAAGLQGPQGVQGATGATGAQGPQGASGTNPAGRNYLINGALDFWQRYDIAGLDNSTISAIVTYPIDRWSLNVGPGDVGISATTISKVTSSLPTGFTTAVQAGNTNGGDGTGIALAQTLSIADSVPLIGQTVCFSFWLKLPSGGVTPTITAQILSNTQSTDKNLSLQGTQGSTDTTVATANFTPTSSWVRCSVSGAVSTSATQVAVQLQWSTPTSATLRNNAIVTGLQLEIGSTPTSFNRNGSNITEELLSCQRYGYAIWANGGASQTLGSGFATAATTVRIVYPLSVRMFAVPTLQSYSLTNTRLWNGTTTLGAASAVSLGFASQSAATLQFTTTGATAGNTYYMDITSLLSSSYYFLNAELP
jgi:hypothetical protein